MPIQNMNSPSHIFQGAIFEIVDELITKIKLGKARGSSQEVIFIYSPHLPPQGRRSGLPTPISPIHNSGSSVSVMQWTGLIRDGTLI
ncbi:MAG: hypothetical protein EWV79_08730 [Microcystis aeruginosa Ma_MB_S_20031200_S102D]|nr:MAG: hypothetical protein EWV79_08730 [Microcystis aeruginosa Ma_MB_S_20031200_S102D]